MIGIEQYRFEKVRVLLNAGANTNIRDLDYKTALDYARESLIRILIEYDPRPLEGWRRRPRSDTKAFRQHYAKDMREIIRLLKEAGGV